MKLDLFKHPALAGHLHAGAMGRTAGDHSGAEGVLCRKSLQAFDDSNQLPVGYEFA